MAEKETIVGSEEGVHACPATEFVKKPGSSTRRSKWSRVIRRLTQRAQSA